METRIHRVGCANGFTPCELIGLMEYIKEEVMAQLKGDIKPDIVKRNVVTDK